VIDHDVAATQLRLSTARFADAYIVTAAGELDLHTAPRLDDELAALTARHAAKIIVDLADVPFIDSTALGVLVAAAKRARTDGSLLILVTNDPRTLRVFEVTGLDRTFNLERSLPDAVGRALDAVDQ
jgi:anti-sigma B factor antagonist